MHKQVAFDAGWQNQPLFCVSSLTTRKMFDGYSCFASTSKSPRLPGINAMISITRSTIPGLTYQLPVNSVWNQTDWRNAGGPLTSTEQTLSITRSIPFEFDPQFFRVVLLPK